MFNDLPAGLTEIILKNTRDGIMITDNLNKIVFVNQSFSDVTGYSNDEVLNKNPSFLQSGKQDSTFFKSMWQDISECNSWEGEIWDKRKNGQIYLEYLSIDVIRDEHNKITHHIAVFTDIHEKYQIKKERDRANTDDLTHLASRDKTINFLKCCLATSKNDCKLLAIMLLDLDDFKKFNDKHGHALGNRVLTVIAKRLKKLVRQSDMVGRFSGDEFVFIFPDLKSMDEVEQMSRRITSLVASIIEIDGRKHRLTASLGITIFPFDNSDEEHLLRHAAQAMYMAKKNGKNQSHLFDIEQDNKQQFRLELFQQVDKAIKENELVLFYQPKVNMRTGTVIGAEALVRWQHPEKGLLGPGEFLPHIEHHDLIIELGNWVLRQALSQLSVWLEQGLKLVLSVNLAARQILQHDFVTSFKKITSEYPDVPLKYLEMEILESAALENTEHVENVIEQCKQMGVSFALDDFGTGYASLSYLRDIPADTLKIDQSFIFGLLTERKNLTLVEGIIGLATAFQRTVIAEGIETTEQGVLLLRLGCDLGQGYGIARPMPAENFLDWLENYKPQKEWSIWADTAWEMSDFPLLVAQYDHINWVRRVLLYIEGNTAGIEKKSIVDHKQCRFGDWYYNKAYERYSHLEAFKEIEPFHILVHQLGHQIIELFDQGETTSVQEKVKSLLQSKDNVLKKLADLQQQVAQYSK